MTLAHTHTAITARPAISVSKRIELSKEGTAAAFGMSAAITVVFNVVLAFIKDSYPPLNTFMAQLTGHHWRAHDLADRIVFVALGLLFTTRGIPSRGLTTGTAITVATATVLASAALGLWFVLV
jgi:hypothetical protein